MEAYHVISSARHMYWLDDGQLALLSQPGRLRRSSAFLGPLVVLSAVAVVTALWIWSLPFATSALWAGLVPDTAAVSGYVLPAMS